MFRSDLLFLAFVSLSGCVAMPSLPPDGHGELITYRTDPGFCLGECPRIELLVSSDGQAVLRLYRQYGYHYREGEIRTRRLRVTPDQLAAFRAQLARARPNGELALDNMPPCAHLIADLEGYDVRWRGYGRNDHLSYNVGCDAAGSDEIHKALAEAPTQLGLTDLPGVGRVKFLEH